MDELDLGPCCACEGLEKVRNVITLNVKGTTPGKGWGCFVCGLSSDGAVAVLCDSCMESKAQPRFAVDGYATEKRRIPIEQLSIPHKHDLSKHRELRVN
jgi:hypothetical protein